MKNKSEDRRSNLNLNVIPGLPKIADGVTNIHLFRTLDVQSKGGDFQKANRVTQGSQLTSHSHQGLPKKATIQTSNSLQNYAFKTPDWAPEAPGKLEFKEPELVNYYLNV